MHCNAEEYSAISVMSQFPFSLHIKSFYNPKQMHFLLLRLQCDPFLNHNSISLSSCACHKIMFSLDLWLLLWQYLGFSKNSFAKCFCSWLQALSSQISHLDGTSGLSRAKFAGNVFNRAAIINCLDGHQRTAFEDNKSKKS